MQIRIPHPRANLAVGAALLLNDIGYLIPCHRVIQESGSIGQHQFRVERKIAMQTWEQARGAGAAGIANRLAYRCIYHNNIPARNR
ncbi:MAG: MGMT family protein [Ignavibacteria bacterium]|nr:MGMT family protein [Ignavibacteria bacterium]